MSGEYSALLEEHRAREERAEQGGGPARLARQKRLGRMSARERIEGLVDPGSFVELGKHVLHRHSETSELLAAHRHPGDGVVAGLARIAGRPVALYAHDPTVLRGALGHAASQKVCRLLDVALERRLPVLTLADSDGVRVEEGVDAIDAYGEILRRTIRLRAEVLQVTLAFGLCVGAAAYAAALGDLVVMVEGQSYLFITGPKVTRVVTGEDPTLDDLGGPTLHSRKTGQCHAVVSGEAEALSWARTLLSFLEPSIPVVDPPERETPELEGLIPVLPRRAYDMARVVRVLVDQGSFFEFSPGFARNLLTGLARLGGRRVAIVASQTMVAAGCLDIDASRKGAHFVAWASKMGIPVLTLVDVPGYLPGTKQEQGGILPHGATLLEAYGTARVPLLCLIVRKSFGGASVLSFSSHVRLALPTARVGPMGLDATLEVVLGPEPQSSDEAGRAEREAKREAWLKAHDHAWASAESGYVDRIVAPSEARGALHQALVALTDKELP